MTSSDRAHDEARELRRSVLRFAIVFAVVIGALVAAYHLLLVNTPPFDAYMTINARASAWLLGIVGVEAVATGPTVVLADGASVSVRRGCDAIQPTAIFLAAVVAFPAPLRRKLLALAIGVPFLLAINLVRIISLVLVADRPTIFDTMHENLWPAAFIFIAVALFVVWTITLTPRKADA